MKTLDNAEVGKNYEIEGFANFLPFNEQEKLISFGFTKGLQVKVVRKTISQKTIQVCLGFCDLVLRSKDACKILIKDL